jgi:oligopeptide/dipeptide ABC transporter ATP-binding protein
MTLLKVSHLKKHFPIRKGFFQRSTGTIKAVDGIYFELQQGETLALVGESGCGKSTAGRTMLKLLEPTDGQIYFKGQELTQLNVNEMRNMRKKMQIIFQDPYASLDPKMKIMDIIAEPLWTHRMITTKNEMLEQVRMLMEIVGLNVEHMDRYPHEFSGGQRQRISIARTLSLRPELVVADECTAALDVSIQAQILNLMKKLQRDYHMALIFVSHDLSVVKHISDRIAVMYLGKIVEFADKRDLYKHPLHPYSQALLASIPIPDPSIRREKILLRSDLPSPINPPSGCVLHPRCPFKMDRCVNEVPELKQVSTHHQVACHLY